MIRALLIIIITAITITSCTTVKREPQPEYLKIVLAEFTPKEGLTKTSIAGTTQVIYLHQSAILTNNDIESARSEINLNTGTPALTLRLTKQGVERLNKGIQHHLQKPMAIIVDNTVISAPVLQELNFGRNISITGIDTMAEAKRLEDKINR